MSNYFGNLAVGSERNRFLHYVQAIRLKFKDQKIKQLNYSKLRKKTYRKTYSRKGSLLKLLNKGILTLDELLGQVKYKSFSEKKAGVFQTIKVGSFGTEKEDYLLRKIKARSQKTELIWLHFGVYTANAVRINNRRQENSRHVQKLAA